MKILIVAAAVLFATQVHADGFVCTSEGHDLKIAVYNKTTGDQGTRNASAMILSDPAIGRGLKTITRFLADSETLLTDHNSSDFLTFIGSVDLRMTQSGGAGEYILGTRLGDVSTLKLEVDFSYGDDLFNGDKTGGYITLTKKSGEQLTRFAACVRYLKEKTLNLR